MGYIEIGKIVAAQGIKGELRVYPNTDFPERFEEPGQRWLLRPNQTEPESIELLSGRYIDGKGLYVIQIKGIRDRTTAESLRDCKLLVPDTDRPELEEGEFHVADLLGLAVYDQTTQELIGNVKDVIPAGHDLLQVVKITPEDGQEKIILIPFVEAIVPVVDLDRQRIEITPPPGLLDL
ncbi:ribosome maturation factor RimM [Pseudanabaenaceae cyanobacterium LEGE 13415]|nr:ribosome maturation factor RimM [Pseudanabaenaceae cyanobacterium LEGE 13415]